jgi:hypothetical protein
MHPKGPNFGKCSDPTQLTLSGGLKLITVEL